MMSTIEKSQRKLPAGSPLCECFKNVFNISQEPVRPLI